MDEKNPIYLFGWAYLLSAFSGLAAVLRTQQQLSCRVVLSALLNSGLFGLAVAMIWCELYGEARHPWFMLGVSMLAGLGGVHLIEWFFQAAQEGLRLYAIRAGQNLPVPGAPAAPQATPNDVAAADAARPENLEGSHES